MKIDFCTNNNSPVPNVVLYDDATGRTVVEIPINDMISVDTAERLAITFMGVMNGFSISDDVIASSTPVATLNSVQRFFKGDADYGILDRFFNEHCVGHQPAALTMDGNGALVVANGDRADIARIFEHETTGQIVVHYYDDPMNVIDPEAIPEHSETYSNVRDAFIAAAARIGCGV